MGGKLVVRYFETASPAFDNTKTSPPNHKSVLAGYGKANWFGARSGNWPGQANGNIHRMKEERFVGGPEAGETPHEFHQALQRRALVDCAVHEIPRLFHYGFAIRQNHDRQASEEALTFYSQFKTPDPAFSNWKIVSDERATYLRRVKKFKSRTAVSRQIYRKSVTTQQRLIEEAKTGVTLYTQQTNRRHRGI